MKRCDVCGTLNFKKNIYCTHCGCSILCENICPFCGYINNDADSICKNCHKSIAIDNFDILFREHNLSLMVNNKISDEEYVDILNRIFKKLDYLSNEPAPPKEKILEMVGAFTEVFPKSSGSTLGEYSTKVIFYDDRLDESIQIATLIHELTHFLLFDITLEILCNILKVQSTPILEIFVDSFLKLPESELFNEYCAHCVENRFMPHEYQNFDSFNQCVKKLSLDDGDLFELKELGKSYAVDIIHYLQKYIGSDLRKDINLQFKKDLLTPDYIDFESEVNVLSISDKNKLLVGLMTLYFVSLYNNEESRNELDNLKSKFMK